MHPDTVPAARDQAADWGVGVFDACVGGGADNARAGSLTVLAGGLADLPPPARELRGVYEELVIDAGGSERARR